MPPGAAPHWPPTSASAPAHSHLFAQGGMPTPGPLHDYKPPEHPQYRYQDLSPDMELRYVTSLEAADALLDEHDLKGPLGFDLEWRPNFVKGAKENPVALVQVADTRANVVLLFQVSAMPSFPAKLKALLADPTVVKAGVGIQGDCKKLFNDWSVATCGCVDLSLLARSVDSQWKGKYSNPLGLARLVESYKRLTMNKSKRLQMSNWAAPLNRDQQDYAANDAHASLILYDHLISLAHLKIPVPKPIYYSYDLLDGLLLEPLDSDSASSTSTAPAFPTASSSTLSGPTEPDYTHSWSVAPQRVLWQARNPEYDPGPPPPPRPPRNPDDPEQPTSARARARRARDDAFPNARHLLPHAPASPAAMFDADGLDLGAPGPVRRPHPFAGRGTAAPTGPRTTRARGQPFFSNALPIPRPPRHGGPGGGSPSASPPVHAGASPRGRGRGASPRWAAGTPRPGSVTPRAASPAPGEVSEARVPRAARWHAPPVAVGAPAGAAEVVVDGV